MYSKLCSLLYFYTIYSTLTNSILPLTTRVHSHLVRHIPFYSLFYISTPFDFNFVSHIYPLHQIYLSKNFYFAFHAATNPCLNFFNFRQAQSLDPRLLEPLKKSWYVVLYDEVIGSQYNRRQITKVDYPTYVTSGGIATSLRLRHI